MQSFLARGGRFLMVLMVGGAFAAGAEDFRLGMEIRFGDVKVNSAVVFSGEYAVALVEDEPAVLFNLKEQWAHDLGSNKRVTLANYKVWYVFSREKSLKTLATTPAGPARDFAAAMMNPEFASEKTVDGFVLKNKFIEYELTGLEKVAADRLASVSMYNVLNAYHAAMTERKMPPDPALAVGAELDKQKVVARRMAVTIRPPGGVIKFEILMTIARLADGDAKLVERAVASAKLK